MKDKEDLVNQQNNMQIIENEFLPMIAESNINIQPKPL